MRSADVFAGLEKVGEGTYGEVYKAQSKDDGSIVALKKIRRTKDQDADGFPITALREIKILKKLRHKNVVDLKEIVTSATAEGTQGEGSIYMVFEYMDHDLAGLMETPAKFTPAQIKCYLFQLLEGMHYCHANQVLHRDIKGANLLINNRGQLKLGDFGLARRFDPEKKETFTNRCITLWYRPPELLLGATVYSTAVDMWSIGCVFAELLTKSALLPGRDEPDQLERICQLCGTPVDKPADDGDARAWPGVSKLRLYGQLIGQPARKDWPRRLHNDMSARLKGARLKETCARLTERDATDAVDLLDKLLTLDPSRRLSAAGALDHIYFWNPVKPAEPSALPTYKSSHELAQIAKKRAAAAAPPPPGSLGGGLRPMGGFAVRPGAVAAPRLPDAGGGLTGLGMRTFSNPADLGAASAAAPLGEGGGSSNAHAGGGPPADVSAGKAWGSAPLSPPGKMPRYQ
jgi:serine/threonine protein kinase